MSRILFIILSLFLLLIVYSFFNPQKAFADSTCQSDLSKCPICPVTITPDPPPLNSGTRKAIFNVLLKSFSGYPFYNMEFHCGLNSLKTNPLTPDNSEISYTLDKTGFQLNRVPCEFTTGDHDIIIRALDSNKREGSILCKSQYNIKDSRLSCNLALSASDNQITTTTQITVNGSDLSKDGTYYVVIDDIANLLKIFAGSTDPSFSLPIPQNFITDGHHTVRVILGTSKASLSDSNTACTAGFDVGTPQTPGQISSPTPIVSSQPCKDPKKCSSAGGEPCDGGSGFKTAIGCIHTSPTGFVKDFISFVVGISGGLAFLMMLLGAFQMLTSAGNPETLQAGRDRFQSAIIGLLFVIFAVLLLKIIGVDILGIPGFGQ